MQQLKDGSRKQEKGNPKGASSAIVIPDAPYVALKNEQDKRKQLLILAQT